MNERALPDLPAIGTVIEVDAVGELNEAYVDVKDGERGRCFSVVAYQDDGVWRLRSMQRGGLRVLLTKQPNAPITKVKITAYCQKKNCCFGMLV